MINQSVLMGRLAREPETRYIQGSDNSVTRFTIAVDRDYKAAGEDKPKTDFISCIAWNKTGEFIAKYFGKGSLILLIGRIETGNYTDKDGKKVYTTELNVEKAHFTGEKKTDKPEPAADEDGFINVPEGIDDDLPFRRPQ